MRCAAAARQRLVFFGFGADEAHRPADDCVPDQAGLNCVSASFTQITQDPGDQVFERVAAAEYFGALQTAAGQVGLQRLDEAALGLGVEILLDGGRAASRT